MSLEQVYLKGSLDKYLKELSERTITPGGGSAAALTAVLGASLNLMVINYSIRDREDAGSPDAITEFRDKQQESLGKLSVLIDKDCEVFGKLMEALSSGGDAQEEYKAAASVPAEVCQECYVSMSATFFLMENGNKNLLTDVGCAAEMLRAAFNSARLNVEINLEKIEDEQFVKELRKTLTETRKDIEYKFSKTDDYVKSTIWSK